MNTLDHEYFWSEESGDSVEFENGSEEGSNYERQQDQSSCIIAKNRIICLISVFFLFSPVQHFTHMNSHTRISPYHFDLRYESHFGCRTYRLRYHSIGTCSVGISPYHFYLGCVCNTPITHPSIAFYYCAHHFSVMPRLNYILRTSCLLFSSYHLKIVIIKLPIFKWK